jgi:pilus assembly protein Flp/PilA
LVFESAFEDKAGSGYLVVGEINRRWNCCQFQRVPSMADMLVFEGFFFGSDDMNLLANKVKKFLKSEDGPTAVEYAVMLALIIVVCLTAIQAIGTRANATFNNVAQQLGSSGTSS